jgi:formamidopyrimidine-DNA glycosylase
MPELPEVETISRALRCSICGSEIQAVKVRDGRLREPVARGRLQRVACGSRIREVRRRGKYVLLDLDGGWTLLVHLGMTGRLLLVDPDARKKPHEHIVFKLKDGRELRFCDPRRFGLVAVLESESLSQSRHLRHLGPEPLSADWSGAYVYAKTRRRSVATKNWLMNATNVVGVGNIYASEALFRAGIDPRRKASTLSQARCARLAAAVVATLEQAIAAGGTTLRDYRSAFGEVGTFSRFLAVYDRDQEACVKCGSRIRHTVQGGRSTYFCGQCQR